ncbi:MAG: lanthionine synthetase, partial [Clostridiales bacterium]|nr:lanthionine synthetase [Clostridiales bacterium]
MDRTEEYLKVARAAMRFIDTRKMKGPAGIFWSLEDAAAGRSIYYDEISMYAGASRILCFLLSLHQATGSEAYLKEAEEAGSYLIWRWENQRELKRNFSPYAFSSGWSGAGFASLLLYEETGRERYAKLAEDIVTQICRDARKSADGAGNYWSDYPGIVGDAGTALFLLRAAETMQRESWKRFAVEAGRIYLNKGRNMGEGRRCYDGVNPVYFGAGLDYVDPNFPMGTAGIGYTLLKLYEASREECFLEAVSGIPDYLSHNAVRIRKGRLLPHGLPDRPDLFYLGYCHGPAGTCRFYYELSKFKDPAECRKMIDSLVKGVQDMGTPELRSEGYWN